MTGPHGPERVDEAAALEQRLEGALLADGGGEVEALATLATALRALDAPPGPSPAFRAQLAARLQLAPRPSSLASPAAEAPAPSTGDLVQALDVHLARLRAGESTIRAALDASPEWAAELEPMLNLALSLEQIELPGPRHEFRQRLRQRLAEAPAPASLSRRPKRLSIWRRLWQSSLAMAAVSAVVVMLLSTGLVVASANAFPREPLYPVKRVVEGARLIMAGDETAMRLHLGYAERRLGEAVVVPPLAGGLLVDFNGQVTAALVNADQAMASGVVRANIVQPLVGWLSTTRGRLVDARSGLPPTAWRASLALVDAAILALREGRIVAAAPIPRLTSADLLLGRSRWAGVVWRPLPGERVAMAAEGDLIDLVPNRPLASTAGAAADARKRPAADPVPGQSKAPRRVAVRVPAPPPVAAEPPPVAPVVVGPPETPPEQSPEPGHGADRGDHGAPPHPTDAPALLPTLEPTAMPALPTDAPTPMPSPTVQPVNVAPVITQKPSCDPHVLLVNQSSGCQVVASDDDGDALTYEWSVPPIYGQIVPADDRTHAVYYADFNMSGVTKQIVTVTVRVRDAAGHSVEESTDVIVMPFFNQGNHAAHPFE